MQFRLPPFWPPRRAILSGAIVAMLQATSRVIYPAAALLVAKQHVATALWLLGLVVVLSLLRAAALNMGLESVRAYLYGRMGEAIAVYPAIAPTGALPVEQIEAQVARGVPWVEAHYCRTWPGLVGSLLALPVVWYLTVRQIGLIASLLPASVLLCAVLVSATTARFSERAADRAWSAYQEITSLVEQGLRGRVELRAHQLSSAHRDKLALRVQIWSGLDRKMRLLGAVTGVAAPLSSLALGISVGGVLGFEVVPWLIDLFRTSPTPSMGTGLLLAATLPLLFDLSRGLSQLSLELPFVNALASFLSFSSATVPAVSGANASGDISFDNVQLAYPNPSGAPDGGVRAHFVWSKGESLAIVGPNGCGKTTLALGLIGALEPRSGSIRFESKPTGAGPSRDSRFAYLSQDAYFDETESVRQSIHFVAPIATDEQVRALFGELGVSDDRGADLLERSVRSLSSGQRRLVAIARVLLRGADILVLDEPEANLGTASRRRVAAVLERVKLDRRMLILTHDEEIANVADRVLAFDQQRTLREG